MWPTSQVSCRTALVSLSVRAIGCCFRTSASLAATCLPTRTAQAPMTASCARGSTPLARVSRASLYHMCTSHSIPQRCSHSQFNRSLRTPGSEAAAAAPSRRPKVQRLSRSRGCVHGDRVLMLIRYYHLVLHLQFVPKAAKRRTGAEGDASRLTPTAPAAATAGTQQQPHTRDSKAAPRADFPRDRPRAGRSEGGRGRGGRGGRGGRSHLPTGRVRVQYSGWCSLSHGVAAYAVRVRFALIDRLRLSVRCREGRRTVRLARQLRARVLPSQLPQLTALVSASWTTRMGSSCMTASTTCRFKSRYECICDVRTSCGRRELRSFLWAVCYLSPSGRLS